MIAEISNKIKIIPVNFPVHCFAENKYTILRCTYTSKSYYINGGWATVTEHVYLISKTTNERLQLLHAINIPIFPKKHYFKSGGETISFILIFPALPEDWRKFDFRTFGGDYLKDSPTEDRSDWVFNNIKRNSTGIYRINLY